MDGGKLEELDRLIRANLDYAAAHDRRGMTVRPPGKRKTQTLNEPQASMVMVEPLLRWLGWGKGDRPDSLWREYVLPRGGRADYACRVGDRVFMTVECKLPGANLRDENTTWQACGYGFFASARFALLTDGLTWIVYRTNVEQDPRGKLVRKIDLRKSSSREAAAFFSFLSMARAERNFPSRTAASSQRNRKVSRRTGKRRRASLSCPEFARHLQSVEKQMGERLLRSEAGRNAFTTASGKRVRFCLSSGKGDVAMFNIGVGHLDDQVIVLVDRAADRSWIVPADYLAGYLLRDNPRGKSAWTPRVVCGPDGEDALWTNLSRLDALNLTVHRHSPGHA